MIPEILIIVSWVLYAVLEGWRDAYFYHYRNTSSHPKNENLHWLYTVERILITVAVFFILPGWFHTGLICMGFIFVFPFFHDGMYFLTRHRLDKKVYPFGWADNSYTSQAVWELKFFERVVGLVIGAALFIAGIF